MCLEPEPPGAALLCPEPEPNSRSRLREFRIWKPNTEGQVVRTINAENDEGTNKARGKSWPKNKKMANAKKALQKRIENA